MPKEQINYPNSLAVLIDKDGNETEYEIGSTPPPGGEVYSDPALSVHWRNLNSDWGSGGVQIDLHMQAGFLKARAANLDDQVTHVSIFTPDLSRAEVNKLIRVLRTARDKAYGTDA